MNEIAWFFIGLFLGLGLDFILVLHMLKPLKKRISELEKGAFVCEKCMCNLEAGSHEEV